MDEEEVGRDLESPCFWGLCSTKKWPPDKQKKATETVIQRANFSAENRIGRERSDHV
jgi:hypothetical protein